MTPEAADRIYDLSHALDTLEHASRYLDERTRITGGRLVKTPEDSALLALGKRECRRALRELNVPMSAAPPDLSTSRGRFAAWMERFQPTTNPNSLSDGGLGIKVFETWCFNDDDLREATPESLIWSLIDADAYGNAYLTPGLWRVNRLGYFICAVPWSDDSNPDPTTGPRPGDIFLEREFLIGELDVVV